MVQIFGEVINFISYILYYEIIVHPEIVSFPVALIKRTHSKSHLRGEKAIWAQSSRAQYVWYFIVRKSKRQETEATGHMTPTIRIGGRDGF